MRGPRAADRHLAGEHRGGEVLHHGRRTCGRAKQAGIEPGARPSLGLRALAGQSAPAGTPEAAAVTTSLGRGERGGAASRRPASNFWPAPRRRPGRVFRGTLQSLPIGVGLQGAYSKAPERNYVKQKKINFSP